MRKSLSTIVIGKPNEQLTDWLNEHDVEYEVRSHSYEPAIARNVAIAQFLDSEKTELMMIDGDQYPITHGRILECRNAPLAYCGSPSRNIPFKAHFGPGDFSAGCFRCTRDVITAIRRKLDELNAQLARVELPFAQPMELGWFGRALRHYGTDEYHCSCEWFNALAKSVGFKAEMVGTIGHGGLVLTRDYTSFATGTPFVD